MRQASEKQSTPIADAKLREYWNTETSEEQANSTTHSENENHSTDDSIIKTRSRQISKPPVRYKEQIWIEPYQTYLEREMWYTVIITLYHYHNY